MKKRLLLLLALVAALFIGGCTGAAESGNYAVVIIAGRHSNMTFPSKDTLLSDSYLRHLVENSVEYGKKDGRRYGRANIHFILCDGDPEEPDEVYMPDAENTPVSSLLYYESGSNDRVRAYFQNLSSWIGDALTNPDWVADNAESDLIDALADARDILSKPSYAEKQKYILVIDNGISTAGYLQMQNFSIQNLSGTDTPDVIVGRLAEDAIINLSGIHVDFFGLGCNDGLYQPKLVGETMKNDLAAFWTAYIEDACGGTLAIKPLRVTSEIKGTPLNVGLPEVTPVAFVDTYTYIPEPSGTKPSKPIEERLVFHEKTLDFIPNSAQFKNRSNAITHITNLTGYFQQVMDYDPDAVFYVVGSIARIGIDHKQENGTLSLERAYEVAKIMVEYAGVPAEKIRLIQGGLNVLPWRNAVEYPGEKEENADSGAMDLNRVVAIVPSIFSDQMKVLEGSDSRYPADLLSIAQPYPG